LNDLQNSLVTGERLPFVVGRRSQLDEQFEMIRSEFAGGSQLCFELAKTIVLIRREQELSKNVDRFFEILNHDIHFLCASLSTRWLVSVCDTIADHGNPQQRTAGICISTFVNLVKLAESERLLCSDAERCPARYLEQWPHDLKDGMTSYHIHHGDMPRNLWRRMDACLHNTPVMQKIFETIMERLKSSENMLSRLAELNPGFWESAG
jgi:hypothetical protein